MDGRGPGEDIARVSHRAQAGRTRISVVPAWCAEAPRPPDRPRGCAENGIADRPAPISLPRTRGSTRVAEHAINGTQRGRKHLLVREYVRSLIVDAEPGSPAPSERDLVEQFGVARMTVRHALDGLVAQGLLERIPGRGTFVTKPLIDMQMRLSS